MKTFKCENLSFNYINGGRDVINNMSIDFEKNQIHVLIGLNGSGKTTLIKLLAGLYKSREGFIILDNRDIHEYSFLERSKYISYVAQGIDIGEDYLVEEYLSFGLMNTLKFYQAPDEENLQKIHEAAVKFKIDHFLDKKMNQLSGGERQIVSICRAYIQDTNIMILDEPTSALDIKNQGIVLKILKEVAESGKTIILSTHNPNHALYLKGKAILIDNGNIIKIGSAQEVVNKEVLKIVYGNNIEYSKNLEYKEVSLV